MRVEVGGIIAAKNCLCALRKAAKAQLSAIPPIFGNPKVSQLKARKDLHPSQASAIALVKAHPGDSFLFTGRNGTGKSHLGWAIYRYAVAARRPLVACPVRDLIAEFRRLETGAFDEGWMPKVNKERLRQRTTKPWLLFLDEFEKARPSEFASEMLFNVLDAAKSFNHQIVVTSNFTARQLRDHWGRIDATWGNSIMTRLEFCHQVEFF